MYYFYGKINWEHVVCLLCGGSPYLGESITGGSTVVYELLARSDDYLN